MKKSRVILSCCVLLVMAAMTACGSKSGEDTGFTTTVATEMTTESITESAASAVVDDDTIDIMHNYVDEAIYPFDGSFVIDISSPIGETIGDPVTFDAEYFESSDLQYMKSSVPRIMMDTYMQMAIDNVVYDVIPVMTAYDLDTNKLAIKSDMYGSKIWVICDGQDTYVLAEDLKTYIKHAGVDDDYIPNAVMGSDVGDLSSQFDTEGYSVEYKGKIYNRASVKNSESDDDVITYYYFDEDKKLEYIAEVYAQALVTTSHIKTLSIDFDDSDYFEVPSDYTEVEGNAESELNDWGISVDAAGDSGNASESAISEQ